MGLKSFVSAIIAAFIVACAAGPSSVAQAQSSSAFTYVYQPGGTAGGNVFTDFGALLSSRPAGPCWILFDGSHSGGTVTVPAGIWDVDNCTFLSRADRTTGADIVVFADGAHLIFGAIELDHFVGETESTSPVVDLSAGQLYVSAVYSTIYAENGAAPFLHVTGSAVATVVGVHGFGIGDGYNPVIEIDSPGQMSLDVNSSYLFDNAMTGNGNIYMMYDSAAFLGSWSASNVHRTVSSLATQVAYSPANPAKWASPAPTTVAEALDRIVAKMDGGI